MTALPACLLVSLWCVTIPLEVLGSWYPGALRGCSTGKGPLTQQFWSMGYRITASQFA